MSFNTNENKVLLWDVLKDTGKFNSLTPSLQKGIKFEFENTMNEIDKQYNNHTLLDKNKIFIQNFTYKLDTFQSPPTFFNDSLNQNAYTAEDIQNQRTHEINEQFTQKKMEMDELLIAKKPEEVDFNDNSKKDEPLENIDAILQKTIQQRNIEIENINTSYDQKKAKKWLDNEKKITFKEEPENIVLETYDTEVLHNDDNKKLFDMLEILSTNQTKILENQATILDKLDKLDNEYTA